MIATKQYDQVINLVNLRSPRVFLNDVRRTKKLLRKCTNEYYVSKNDVKELHGHNVTLDRSHLNYLIKHDPELVELQTPQEGRQPIFMNVIEYSFGLIHRTID